MELIREIEINDFRSIQSATLAINSGYLPIVGPNNSGKSNILRALHLFFTDEVEPDRPLRLARDFHNPSRNRKKELSVCVKFRLPENFNYRKNIRDGLNALLGDTFSIRKTWSYEQSPQGFVTDVEVAKEGEELSRVASDEEYRVQQFFNLIKFRYQPNHIHPSEVLQREESELQSALLFRLNRLQSSDSPEFDRIFDHMRDVASDLVKPISERLQVAAQQVEELELSTPAEFGDVLFSFVPRLKVRAGEKFEALQHGSGIQSYLTYLMLSFLDTRFEAKFGWQQATIWALEEPESFLHQSLQHELAAFLAETGTSDRFQIFATTHSDVFTRHGSHGVLCRLKEGRTQWSVHPARILSGEAAKRGVTAFVHPLLFAPQKPLLLVEGETDRRYLELAYRILGRINPWNIRDLGALDLQTDLQGVDGLRTYLGGNRGALRTRPYEAPCFVLVDWNESESKVKRVRKEVEVHHTSKVIQWREDECNAELHQSFAGIERALSTELIREAEGRDLLVTLRPTEAPVPLHLDRSSLEKTRLVEFAEQRELESDVQHFKDLIDRLEEELKDSLTDASRLISGSLFPSE